MLRQKKSIGTIVCVVLLVALITMYISLHADRNALKTQNDDNRAYVAARLYVEINNMRKRYDEFRRYSSQDALSLLADMRMYAYTADALSAALVNAYGESYAIFNRATYTRIASLILDCERAFKSGLSPTQIIDDLGEMISRAEQDADTRFTPGGELRLKVS